MYKKNTDKIPKDSQLRLAKVPKIEGQNYTWEAKIDAVTKYMALGNFRLVSELNKIPYRTLMAWRKEPWWAELVEEIKKTRQTELNTKLSKIVDKSLAVIEDRLDHGDFVLNNKTGEVVRKPVSIKEANTVTKDLLAHQARQEEMIANIEIRKETVAEQLKILADEFSKWSRQISKKTATTIEYKEKSDAVHDEREARLQEGSGEVYEPSFGSEEADTAERGSEGAGETRLSA